MCPSPTWGYKHIVTPFILHGGLGIRTQILMLAYPPTKPSPKPSETLLEGHAWASLPVFPLLPKAALKEPVASSRLTPDSSRPESPSQVALPRATAISHTLWKRLGAQAQPPVPTDSHQPPSSTGLPPWLLCTPHLCDLIQS